jgi:hypothetical protein
MNPAALRQPLDRLTFRVAGREAERVAVREQPLGDRQPDPGVRAGDERDLGR